MCSFLGPGGLLPEAILRGAGGPVLYQPHPGMKVTVQWRQSLSDIALRVYGDVAGVVAIARANGLSVTSDLAPGQVLHCPDVVYDNYLQTYVRRSGIRPATLYDGLGEISQRAFSEQYTIYFS